MTELMPCPFCGSPAEVLEGGSAFVVCCSGDEDACDTQPSTWRYSTLEAATAKWNTRPTAQAVAVDDAMALALDEYLHVEHGICIGLQAARAALQAAMGGVE